MQLAEPDEDESARKHPHPPAGAGRTCRLQTGSTLAVQFTQPANRATRVEAATHLTPPIAWQFLNVPENRPGYPATAQAVSIAEATNAAQKFYRVRVTAP